jgi:glycosyltransferase involved in cell wall biosynthesis
VRIGVVPTNFRPSGGTFQYSLAFLDALRHVKTGDDFVVFHRPRTDLPIAELKSWGFDMVATTLLDNGSPARAAAAWAIHAADRLALRGRLAPLRERIRRRRLAPLVSEAGSVEARRPRGPIWRALFSRYRIDLMVYLVEMDCAAEAGIPYIAVIHDLLHRSAPHFPEAFVHGPREYYDRLFADTARHAVMTLVHDQTVKDDLAVFYGQHGVTANRVRVLPLQPAPYLRASAPLDVLSHCNLPGRYVFYPARFWPHKNHETVLRALRLLKSRHDLAIPLVLAGFDGSSAPPPGETSFRDMRELAESLGISDQVYYLGMVPDDQMAALYRGAVALVMPTYCPPLAIPVFEAWQLGCPVLTSDLRGIAEQVGDAALVVDPSSVDAVAAGIQALWMDAALCAALVARGFERATHSGPEQYARQLTELLREAKDRIAI